MPVLWAGVLIALSVCFYGINRPRLWVAFGLAAIFFRELALPYGVLCAAIAWRRGRRGELFAWIIGLAAWLAFFGMHWWQVHEWMAAGLRAHRESWVQFGGIGFVISIAQMNAYLLLLPQWVTALFLVAALVGFCRMDDAPGPSRRWGRVSVFSGVFRRGPEFQSVLGSAVCSPALLRRCEVAGFA